MAKYDVMIVLGGGIDNDGNLTNLSTQRLDLACKLYQKAVAPKIFAIGGPYSTWNPRAIKFERTGADIRSEYMQKKGVDPAHIVKVENGRDTITEALATRKALHGSEFRKLLVVTSDKHMERSLFIFRRVFGPEYTIGGAEAPCGDLLNTEEERDYLAVAEKLFSALPKTVPDPENWESWYQEHVDVYDDYQKIHTKYVQGAIETNQAYMGIKNG
jgi:uncharacterized SAM-binding protein YcdF (DUF218 family)